jgi:SNF2 family DNA or RNA helicase
VTTYETVIAEKDFLHTITFRTVALDEAHRIKGGDTLIANTMQSVRGARAPIGPRVFLKGGVR